MTQLNEQQARDWIKSQLQDLANTPHADIEGGSIEIYGEDEAGNEGSCEVEIPSIARQAVDLIASLESRIQHLSQGRSLTTSKWISVKDREPPTAEPVVYCQKRDEKKFAVGVAYWTVSEKWSPEAESVQRPEGFTHWMPLPEPPMRCERSEQRQSD